MAKRWGRFLSWKGRAAAGVFLVVLAGVRIAVLAANADGDLRQWVAPVGFLVLAGYAGVAAHDDYQEEKFQKEKRRRAQADDRSEKAG